MELHSLLLKAACHRCLLPVAVNAVAPVRLFLLLLLLFDLLLLCYVLLIFVVVQIPSDFSVNSQQMRLFCLGNREKTWFCVRYKQTVKAILWLFSPYFWWPFSEQQSRLCHCCRRNCLHWSSWPTGISVQTLQMPDIILPQHNPSCSKPW